MKIKKGDTVQIIAGKDRGKTGTVTRVLPQENRIIVDGVNERTRHQRANRQTRQGGQVVTFAAPIHVSNAQIVDPKTQTPTRVRIERGDDGSRTRIAVKSGTSLDA